MKVVITGASGFLGPHLRTAFGDGVDVVGLCRTPTAEWMQAADVLEIGSLRGAFEGADVVVHAAGGVAHSADDAGAMNRVHVDGTRNVLEAAQEAGVEKVVLVSTSGTVAVSADSRVLDEDGPDVLGIVSGWPYYRAKLFAEQLAMEFEGLDVFVLNPTLLLGPGDARRSSTDSVRLFLDGQIPAAPSGGLSFVDVRDVAAAVPLVLERGTVRRRYLLGAVNLTFAAFYERLARVAGMQPPKVRLPKATGTVLGWMPSGVRGAVADRFGVDRVELEMASHFWYLDSRRAQTELGWAPRDPNETLLDTVEDLRG